MLTERWQIQLLGTLSARQGDRVVTRFRTRKTASLLAYLAYHQQTSHSREALVERFWPQNDLEDGRHSLRTALSSLRRQLEPPGVPAGTVVAADPLSVRLNPAAAVTDVRQFSALVSAAGRAADPAVRVRLLGRAVRLCRGPLLPGFYDEWVTREQQRITDRLLGVLCDLTETCKALGQLSEAIEHAHAAAAADPLSEPVCLLLMRLYMATSRPADAMALYSAYERALRDELDERPSSAAQALASECVRLDGTAAGATARGSRSPRQAVVPAVAAAGRPAPPAVGRPECGLWGPCLPPQFTRFFGRVSELALLSSWLTPRAADAGPQARLVTITGPGGAGKTRLAIEAAEGVVDRFERRVWFVPLAEISSAASICAAVAGALHVAEGGEQDLLDRVNRHLASKPALLVLDNLEQIVGGAGSVLRRLLEAVPALMCLATSRHAVGIAAEQVLYLTPLPLPDACSNAELIAQVPSVALFVDRAQRVRPDFQISERNAQEVAALCTRLDGIPLALELAAGRAQTLSPAQMLTQMGDRFAFLVSRQRDALERHRTLRSAIEWSYRLLPSLLQEDLRCLSIFRGGWTLEAAQSVCRCDDVLGRLTLLMAHSLVLAEEGPHGMRYRMLESIREFATEQHCSAEVGEFGARHAACFLGLAEKAEPLLRGPTAVDWRARLDAEHDNILAAVDWCHTSPTGAELELRFVAALAAFWRAARWRDEAIPMVEAALARPPDGVRDVTRARALCAAGQLFRHAGHPGARRSYEEAAEIARELGDDSTLAAALRGLGMVAWSRGDTAAMRVLTEESLSLYRKHGMCWEAATALNNLALAAIQEGDYELARGRLHDSAAGFRLCGCEHDTAIPLLNLGSVLAAQGAHERAHHVLAESLAHFEANEDASGVWQAEFALGVLAIVCGDLDEAATWLRRSIEAIDPSDTGEGAAVSEVTLACISALKGDGGAARPAVERGLEVAQSRSSSMQETYLPCAAALMAAAGRPALAARALGAARSAHFSPHGPLLPMERAFLTYVGDHLRESLPADAFPEARTERPGPSWGQAVTDILDRL